jgi:hypothetical protein
MYQAPHLRTNVYESGWLAVSDDGCHWKDGGAVAPEHPGDMWWKGFVRQIRGDAANMTDDALFIMDHGVFVRPASRLHSALICPSRAPAAHAKLTTRVLHHAGEWKERCAALFDVH